MRLVLCLFSITCILSSVTTQIFRQSRLRRQTEIENNSNVFHIRPDNTGQCIEVKTEEGVYIFSSPGTQQICGLYMIAEPDLVIEFEFAEFEISCTKGGVLSVIDGWELNGQFFPGNDDHPKPRSQRFSEYCGSKKPWKKFITSQNVGLLEFRVPFESEGFTVTVRFRDNTKPCNVILQDPQGAHTLRNYGRRINCSLSIIYPMSFHVLASSVGSQTIHSTHNLEIETGIVRKCKKRGFEDFVEIRGGDGLDPEMMSVVDDFCGLDSISSKRSQDIACGNTAVRLVSSGRYENSVTVSYDMLLDFSSPMFICPSVLALL